MKRTYISPVTTVITIHIRSEILTTSEVSVSSTVYEEGSMTDLVKSNNHYSVWDNQWNSEE